MSWWWAFVLTLVVEVPLWVTFLGRWSAWLRLLYAVGLNLLTHPLLWWAAHGHGWATIAALELVVVAVEGTITAVLWRRGALWSLLTALVINAASVLAGLLVTLVTAL